MGATGGSLKPAPGYDPGAAGFGDNSLSQAQTAETTGGSLKAAGFGDGSLSLPQTAGQL